MPAAGEYFNPTAENIQKQTRCGGPSTGVKTAVLVKKMRGELATFELTLRYGNAEFLQGANHTATLFFPILMMRGTKKHNRQEIEDALDKLKAKLNASGSGGQVTFSVQCSGGIGPGGAESAGRDVVRADVPGRRISTYSSGRCFESLEQGRTDRKAPAFRTLLRKLAPYPKDDARYTPTVEESLQRLEAVTVDQVRKLYEDQLGGQAGEFVAVGDFEAAPC